MEVKIFYSWQSDLPNATNRGFIQNALEKVAQEIRKDNTINIEPVIDRDTVGVPGSPDIASTIFSKIETSQIFVCDISIINQSDSSRKTPNPNVLIELGFALKMLGDKRVILVLNSAYGSPELLPFDLRMRRIITYNVSFGTEEKIPERKKLEGKIDDAFRAIIIEFESRKPNVVNKGGKYLIGRRLKYIRTELELQSSEFIELAGVESEQTYLKKEADLEECSEREINLICRAFGIQPEFIKHGHLPIIQTEILNWPQEPLKAAQNILNLSPKALFLTVTASTLLTDLPIIQQGKNLYYGIRGSYLRTGLLVQTERKKYKVIDLNIELSYWDDQQNTKYLLEFYMFLSALSEDFMDFRFLQIPSFKDTEDLFSGNILPERFVRKYYKYYGFVHQLLDYKSQNFNVMKNERRYGKWLKKLHEAFQRNIN
ncbi:MAG: nucleotide-binding protein [Chloroflexi bacterium]|nr:nucleotide-binding protein [Chloroflexota bacterium]